MSSTAYRRFHTAFNMPKRARIKHKLRPLAAECKVKRLCPHCALPVHKATFYRHKAENFVRRTQKWVKAEEWRYNADELRSDPRWGEPAFSMIQAWLKTDVQLGDFEQQPMWRSEAEDLEQMAHVHIKRRAQQSSSEGLSLFPAFTSASFDRSCLLLRCCQNSLLGCWYVVDGFVSLFPESSSSSSSSDESDIDDGAGIFARPVFSEEPSNFSNVPPLVSTHATSGIHFCH